MIDDYICSNDVLWSQRILGMCPKALRELAWDVIEKNNFRQMKDSQGRKG